MSSHPEDHVDSIPLRRMPPDQTTFSPTGFRQKSSSELAITWSDGTETVYPVRALRLACACARCVDEWSGEERLDPASVPDDVHPLKIEPVGRYAIQIAWSDGHNTGIYPFRRLRTLSNALADDSASDRD